jgi:hypothetical protein
MTVVATVAGTPVPVDDVDAGLARGEQLCRAVGRRSPTAVACERTS